MNALLLAHHRRNNSASSYLANQSRLSHLPLAFLVFSATVFITALYNALENDTLVLDVEHAPVEKSPDKNAIATRSAIDITIPVAPSVKPLATSDTGNGTTERKTTAKKNLTGQKKDKVHHKIAQPLTAPAVEPEPVAKPVMVTQSGSLVSSDEEEHDKEDHDNGRSVLHISETANLADAFEQSLNVLGAAVVEGHFHKALYLINQMSEQDKRSISVRMYQARIFLALENYVEAEHHYRLLAQQEPSVAKWWMGLGFCKEKQGEHALAAAAYQQALLADTAQTLPALALTKKIRLLRSL